MEIGIQHHNVVPNDADTLASKQTSFCVEDANLLVATLPTTLQSQGILEDDDFSYFVSKQSFDDDILIVKDPTGQQFYQPPPAGNYSETEMRFLAASPIPSHRITDCEGFTSVLIHRDSPQNSVMAINNDMGISAEPEQASNPPTASVVSAGGRRRGRKPKSGKDAFATPTTIPKKKKKYEMFDPLNPSNDKDVKNAALAKRNREKQKEQIVSMKDRITALEQDKKNLQLRVTVLEDEKKRLEFNGSHWQGKFIEVSQELSRLETVLTTNAQHIAAVQGIVIADSQNSPDTSNDPIMKQISSV